METIKEFATRIKLKYPEYKDKEDNELVQRIITKYPEYKSKVDLSQNISQVRPSPAIASKFQVKREPIIPQEEGGVMRFQVTPPPKKEPIIKKALGDIGKNIKGYLTGEHWKKSYWQERQKEIDALKPEDKELITRFVKAVPEQITAKYNLAGQIMAYGMADLARILGSERGKKLLQDRDWTTLFETEIMKLSGAEPTKERIKISDLFPTLTPEGKQNFSQQVTSGLVDLISNPLILKDLGMLATYLTKNVQWNVKIKEYNKLLNTVNDKLAKSKGLHPNDTKPLTSAFINRKLEQVGGIDKIKTSQIRKFTKLVSKEGIPVKVEPSTAIAPIKPAVKFGEPAKVSKDLFGEDIRAVPVRTKPTQAEGLFTAQAKPKIEMPAKIAQESFITKENQLLQKSGLNNTQQIQYIQSTMADGEKLNVIAKKAISGEITDEQAVKQIKDDFNKLAAKPEVKAPIKQGGIQKPVDETSTDMLISKYNEATGKIARMNFKDERIFIEGKPYNEKQAREIMINAIEKKPTKIPSKTTPVLTVYEKELLPELKQKVKEFEAGQRFPMRDEEGYLTGEVVASKSTFADWMRDIPKKEALELIAKAETDTPLTPKQMEKMDQMMNGIKSEHEGEAYQDREGIERREVERPPETPIVERKGEKIKFKPKTEIEKQRADFEVKIDPTIERLDKAKRAVITLQEQLDRIKNETERQFIGRMGRDGILKKQMIEDLEYKLDVISNHKIGLEKEVDILKQETPSGGEEEISFEQPSAAIDKMTGLNNKNYYLANKESFMQRAIQSGEPLSVAMIDADKFKEVNDNYGHAAGDKFLRDLGTILKEEAEKSGFEIIRYGGEEFIAIGENIDENKYRDLMEGLRQRIEKTDFMLPSGQKIKKTISIGIAERIEDKITDMDALVKTADDRVYKAKDTGRNKIISREEHETFKQYKDQKIDRLIEEGEPEKANEILYNKKPIELPEVKKSGDKMISFPQENTTGAMSKWRDFLINWFGRGYERAGRGLNPETWKQFISTKFKAEIRFKDAARTIDNQTKEIFGKLNRKEGQALDNALRLAAIDPEGGDKTFANVMRIGTYSLEQVQTEKLETGKIDSDGYLIGESLPDGSKTRLLILDQNESKQILQKVIDNPKLKRIWDRLSDIKEDVIQVTAMGTTIPGISRPAMAEFLRHELGSIPSKETAGVDLFYTPDIPVEERTQLGRTFNNLASIFSKNTKINRMKFKTGAAKLYGKVKPLPEAYGQARKEMAKEYIRRGTVDQFMTMFIEKVPATGLPQGWVEFDTGIIKDNEIVQKSLMRIKDDIIEKVGEQAYKDIYSIVKKAGGRKLMVPAGIAEYLGAVNNPLIQIKDPQMKALVDTLNQAVGLVNTMLLTKPSSAHRNALSELIQQLPQSYFHFFNGAYGFLFEKNEVLPFAEFVQGIKSIFPRGSNFLKDMPKDFIIDTLWGTVGTDNSFVNKALWYFKLPESIGKKWDVKKQIWADLQRDYYKEVQKKNVPDTPEGQKFVKKWMASYLDKHPESLFEIYTVMANHSFFRKEDPLILKKLYDIPVVSKATMPFLSYQYNKARLLLDTTNPFTHIKGFLSPKLTQAERRKEISWFFASIATWVTAFGLANVIYQQTTQELGDAEHKEKVDQQELMRRAKDCGLKIDPKFNTAGRLKILANKDYELWARVMDIPFIGEATLLLQMFNGEQVDAQDYLNQTFSVGPIATGVLMTLGFGSIYSPATIPLGARLGKQAFSASPYSWVAEMARQLDDPVKRKYWDGEKGFLGNLYQGYTEGLPGFSVGYPERTFQTSALEARNLPKTAAKKYYYEPTEVLLKNFFLNVHNIPPEERLIYFRDILKRQLQSKKRSNLRKERQKDRGQQKKKRLLTD